MMMELLERQMHAALPLFADKETLHIARSCCGGLVPCRIFADDAARPTAAVIFLRRFGIAFAAGDSRHALPLLACLRGFHPWYLVFDAPEGWHPALAAFSPQSHAVTRYAFDTSPGQFDLEALRRMAAPPEGCEILPYDKALLDQSLAAPWSEDQMGAFETPEAFLRDGFGLALVRDGEILSGCASFCRHADGYEIQVDTRPDMQGRGYAVTISAAFILACLSQGKAACWDAANRKSMRLAQKLGYAFMRAYTGWLLIPEGTNAAEARMQAVGE